MTNRREKILGKPQGGNNTAATHPDFVTSFADTKWPKASRVQPTMEDRFHGLDQRFQDGHVVSTFDALQRR
jgi:hypothetical protein